MNIETLNIINLDGTPVTYKSISNNGGGGGGGNTPSTPDMPVIGDGKTYLYIKIAAPGRMSVPLYFSQTVANGVTIDWGDGSATQTLSGTGKVSITHTYTKIGKYTIILNPLSGCTLGLGHSSSTYCVMGSINNNDIVYRNMLQAVEIGINATRLYTYAFQKCQSLSSVVIPESVTSIPEYAFSYCSSLSSIVIPNSITRIDALAFLACHSLSSIIIPESVREIGGYNGYSFQACSSLSSIVIPDGVTKINSGIFDSCFSLSSIIIPKSVTNINNFAFASCYGMAFYDFSQCTSVPTLAGTYAFDKISSDCKMVVPDALYDTWIAATNWSTYASKIVKASEFNS